ncbi:MAG: proteasome alpha subunit, partial [Nocardioidaceae bacterium]|nr:proteasome alpha subunit [Nocardioidaceae bacterium]
AEVGDTADDDQIYRLMYDGSVADVQGFGVMGGESEQVEAHLGQHYKPNLKLDKAISIAVTALGQDVEPARTVEASALEVAVLTRTRSQPRKFRRLSDADVSAALGS